MNLFEHLGKMQVIHSKVIKIEGEYYIRIYLKGKDYDLTLQVLDSPDIADELTTQLKEVEDAHIHFIQTAQKQKQREQDMKIAYA